MTNNAWANFNHKLLNKLPNKNNIKGIWEVIENNTFEKFILFYLKFITV